MFGNFRNGVFAFGIFLGFLVALFLYLGLSYLEYSLSDIVSSALFGVVLGSLLTVVATIWVRTKEIHQKAADTATVLQIRIARNIVVLNAMKRTISEPKVISSSNNSHKGFPDGLGWITEFHALPDTMKLETPSAEELSFLMRISPIGKKEDMVSTWTLASITESQYGATASAVHDVIKRMGLPNSGVLRHGSYEVALDDQVIIDMKRISDLFDRVVVDIEKNVQDMIELLYVIHDGLNKKLGVRAHFLDIINKSETTSK